MWSRCRWSRSFFSKIKICCKEPKWEGTNAEWHVKTPSSSSLSSAKSKAGKWIAAGWFWSLPLGSGRNFVSKKRESIDKQSTNWECYLGSFPSGFPLPYRGITLSLLIPALQTGQICLLGLVSIHWWMQGQQKRCPHMEITASRATSKQMLHWN